MSSTMVMTDLVVLKRVQELKMTCFTVQARVEHSGQQIGPKHTHVAMLLPTKQLWGHLSPECVATTTSMALLFEDPSAVDDPQDKCVTPLSENLIIDGRYLCKGEAKLVYKEMTVYQSSDDIEELQMLLMLVTDLKFQVHIEPDEYDLCKMCKMEAQKRPKREQSAQGQGKFDEKRKSEAHHASNAQESKSTGTQCGTESQSCKEEKKEGAKEERKEDKEEKKKKKASKFEKSLSFTTAAAYKRSEVWWCIAKTKIPTDCKLVIKFQDIPWPPHDNPAFILQADDLDTRNKKVKLALLRWHPDKLVAQRGACLEPGDRSKILVEVQVVAEDVLRLRHSCVAS